MAEATYERHPLSALFPDMPDQDYGELVESIRAHGQREPIVIYEDMILDGWHRYRAANDAEVEPQMRYLWEEDGDPREYVLALNLQRRHIPAHERAEITARVYDWRPVGVGDASETDNFVRLTNQQMADKAGVSPTTIKSAKRKIRAEQDGVEPEPDAPRRPSRTAQLEEANVMLEHQVGELQDQLREASTELHDKRDKLDRLENAIEGGDDQQMKELNRIIDVRDAERSQRESVQRAANEVEMRAQGCESFVRGLETIAKQNRVEEVMSRLLKRDWTMAEASGE